MPAVAVAGGVSQVLLGTLQVAVGNTASTFTLAEHDSGGGNTLTFDNFYDLDTD